MMALKAQTPHSYSDSIDVLHYDINLNIHQMGAQHIDGFTVLTMTPKVNNVNYVSLDLLALVADSAKVDSNIAAFTQVGEKLNIDFSSAINIGDTVNVTVYYGGHPVIDNSSWGGFYWGSDSLSAFNLGVGFEANPHNYGRVWFPCLDDFVDRATYDFRIRVDSLNMAVCGGIMSGMQYNGDSTKTVHWYLSDPIPTYLASVAVGRYVKVSDSYQGLEKNIPIEIYVRPQDSSKVAGTFVNLKPSIQIFENHFGPYKWQRVGYVGVSFNSGAMEHATNIAYPSVCVNGGTTYDDLMSHEFSHHWFGNLITCSTAGDMWINEGWADFCEFVFFEDLYGREYVKNLIRTSHKEVIQMAHHVDGDYWPLYGIPTEITYCSTVYQKGALVANNLKAYLGDSLFYCAIKAFIATHLFKDVSSSQLRDFLSAYTQRDMTDFFDNWVFTGGFPHFAVDSFPVTNIGGGQYKVDVYVKQKKNGRTTFSNSNIVEMTFANNNWQFTTDTMVVSGQYAHKSFIINFNPTEALLNFDEKSCFAATSYIKKIVQPGNFAFPETYFSTVVSQISDSALLRVTHNWVGADSMKINNPDIVRLSDYRYWTVDGVNLSGLKANGRFNYNRSAPVGGSFSSNGWLDNTLFSVSADSLLLLYRKDASDDWKIQHFTRIGNNLTGFVTADTLKEGQYVLAIGKPVNASLNENIKTNPFELKVVPNPSNSAFNIYYPDNFKGLLKISDNTGRVFENVDIAKGTSVYNWHPENVPNGVYMVMMQSDSNEMVTKKIVFQR